MFVQLTGASDRFNFLIHVFKLILVSQVNIPDHQGCQISFSNYWKVQLLPLTSARHDGNLVAPVVVVFESCEGAASSDRHRLNIIPSPFLFNYDAHP